MAWELLLPQPSWLPLGIVMLAFGGRLRGGNGNSGAVGIEAGLCAFLLTGLLGVWAAYDLEAAGRFFWMIGLGIALCLAVMRLDERRLWSIAAAAALLAAFLSLVFVLVHDWGRHPADFPILNSLGLAWMRVRPVVALPQIPPNTAGGILAALLPLSLANTLRSSHVRGGWRLYLDTALTCAAGVGLLMTSSRGAWAALLLSLVVLLGWWVIRKMGIFSARVFYLGVIISLLFAGALVLHGPAATILGRLDRALPGAPAMETRARLASSAAQLASDFSFTGGGLQSFAGLYSRYILVIPQFFFAYAHNLYLDVAIAQGWGGLAALVLLFIAGAWAAAGRLGGGSARLASAKVLAAAILTGMLTLLIHGWVDDSFYSGRGVLLLFLYPGMAVALGLEGSLEPRAKPAVSLPGLPRRGSRAMHTIGLAVLAAGLLLFSMNGRRLASRWYSNLASVRMARSELAGWPASAASGIYPSVTDVGIRRLLLHAIELDPDNPSAQYRLGSLALAGKDFGEAVRRLARAHEQAPDHQGVEKSLGFAYLWAGEEQKGIPLLSHSQDAQTELRFYAELWRRQGESELARRAWRASMLLEPAPSGRQLSPQLYRLSRAPGVTDPGAD